MLVPIGYAIMLTLYTVAVGYIGLRLGRYQAKAWLEEVNDALDAAYRELDKTTPNYVQDWTGTSHH